MSDPVQVLLLLDLASDNPIAKDEVTAQLPDKRAHRITLRLSTFGIQPGPYGSAVDWDRCADAVGRMVDKARAECSAHPGPAHFYVAGRAALPIFTYLGAMLSKWASVTILNQRQDKTWDVLALAASPSASKDRFFTVRGLGDPSEATGRVAVFVSTGHATPRDQIREFFTSHGEGLAGIVEVVTPGSETTQLDKAHATAALDELTEALAGVRRAYPSTHRIALFIGGPASLAFLAGRAVNPTVLPDVWIPNYKAPNYHDALAIPWKTSVRAEVSHDAEHELARGKALRPMLKAIKELQKTLTLEHLPPFLSATEQAQLLGRLQKIKIADEPRGDAFDLSIAEGTMAFGRGLLDALLRVSDDDRIKIGQSIFLHEVYHFDQHLQSSTYAEIGRAGFALEEVDYWADVVALGTLATWEIQRGGESGKVQARKILLGYLGAALAGIEAFDRSEQGDRLDRLAERRLRRYLIWRLQYARAKSLKDADQIWQLFRERLIVELAPLDSHLDDRHDKVVRGAIATTELFVVLQGKLVRVQRGPSFDPVALIEAVRAFDGATLDRILGAVRDTHHGVLTPWVT